MAHKTNKHKPNSIVITIPDPDSLVCLPIAEIGGTMEWRTESVDYPDFEVQFVGENPVDTSKNYVGKGSRTEPLILHVAREGTFQYTVVHHPRGGGSTVQDPIAAGRVVPCPHCPP